MTQFAKYPAPASGGVSTVTASSPLSSSGGSTPNLTIQNADATHTGALLSTDWILFNGKQSTLWVEAAGALQPNTTADRVLIGGAIDDSASSLQVNGNITLGLTGDLNGAVNVNCSFLNTNGFNVLSGGNMEFTNFGGSIAAWLISSAGTGDTGPQGLYFIDTINTATPVIEIYSDASTKALLINGAVNDGVSSLIVNGTADLQGHPLNNVSAVAFPGTAAISQPYDLTFYVPSGNIDLGGANLTNFYGIYFTGGAVVYTDGSGTVLFNGGTASVNSGGGFTGDGSSLTGYAGGFDCRNADTAGTALSASYADGAGTATNVFQSGSSDPGTLNGSYWGGSGVPTTLTEALDRIAAVISAGGATPIP